MSENLAEGFNINIFFSQHCGLIFFFFFALLFISKASTFQELSAKTPYISIMATQEYNSQQKMILKQPGEVNA